MITFWLENCAAHLQKQGEDDDDLGSDSIEESQLSDGSEGRTSTSETWWRSYLAVLVDVLASVCGWVEWVLFVLPAGVIRGSQRHKGEYKEESFRQQLKWFAFFAGTPIALASYLLFVESNHWILDVVALLGGLFSLTLVLSIAYRRLCLTHYYVRVQNSVENQLDCETFLDDVKRGDPRHEVLAALNNYPFLHRLCRVAPFALLLIFPIVAAALHRLFGVFPNGAEQGFFAWFFFSLDSVFRSCLEIQESFGLDFSPINSGGTLAGGSLIFVQRTIVAVLLLQAIKEIITQQKDPVAGDAERLARLTWRHHVEASEQLDQLGGSVAVDAFCGVAQQAGSSVHNWIRNLPGTGRHRSWEGRNLTVPLMALARGPVNFTIDRLNLRGAEFSSEAFRQVLAIPIEALWAYDTACVNDECFRDIETLGSLKDLKLRTTNITKETLRCLAPLCPNLEKLDLGGNRLDDEVLEFVAMIPSLKELSLSRVGLSVDGNGSRRTITDEGLQALKGLSELKRLDVRQTAVTRAGIDRLASSVGPLEGKDADGNPIC